MEQVQAFLPLVALGIIVLFSLITGLDLRPGDLRRTLRRPVFWRGFLAALVGVPLLAVAIVSLLPVGRRAEELLLLVAVSPGVVLLTRAVRKVRGSTILASELFLTLTLTAVLLLPYSLALLERLGTGV